jgi:dihydrodipicolinate synthase/N-acetylneuraminate lyase
MTLLNGTIPILPTPFDEHGEVDLASLRNTVSLLIDQRVNGLGTLALASEGYKLSEAERQRVLSAVVEAAGGRVPIVASVYHEATQIAAAMSAKAVALGADAVMLLPPVIGKAGGKELVQHLASAASAAEVPVVIQDTPQIRGAALALGDYARLLDAAPNVAYAKIEAVPAGEAITRLLSEFGGRIEVIAGWGGLEWLDALERGACGCMPGADVGPRLGEVYTAYRAGEIDRARSTFDSVRPLIEFSSHSLDRFVIVAKTALARKGVIASAAVRPPYTALEAHEAAEMDRLLRAAALA